MAKLRGAAKAAFLRRMASGRRKRSHGAVRRSSRGASSTLAHPKRRRRSSGHHVALFHARRRSGGGGGGGAKGLVGTAIQGVKDAALIVGGKGATNLVARFVPTGGSVAGGIAARIGSAVLVGLLARRALGADAARFALAGGLVAPIEAAAKAANIPVLSDALGDDDGVGAYYDTIGSYLEPRLPLASTSINTNGVSSRHMAGDYENAGSGVLY